MLISAQTAVLNGADRLYGTCTASEREYLLLGKPKEKSGLSHGLDFSHHAVSYSVITALQKLSAGSGLCLVCGGFFALFRYNSEMGLTVYTLFFA